MAETDDYDENDDVPVDSGDYDTDDRITCLNCGEKISRCGSCEEWVCWTCLVDHAPKCGGGA